MDALVLIPAFNEGKIIGRVIRGLFEHGWKQVVVIDDGSNDDTAEEAQKAGALVLCHKINRGQGAALETGNEYARRFGANFVVHFDGDNQMNAEDIAGALRRVESGETDIVLGSRFLDNRSRLPWSKKYVILPLSRWVNFVFTGVKLTDAHNGFRIFNRRALNAITITQDGMAHNTEIPRQIKKYNLKFVEYPVEIVYHEYGQGMGGGLRVVIDLIKALFV